MELEAVVQLDRLFDSRNDVLFAREFVTDVESLKFPTGRDEKVPKRGITEPISGAAVAVIYRWTEQELQYFFGSLRHVVGAKARKIELNGCWMVSVEFIQLLGHSVAVIFAFDEAAQVIRVLAAMPTALVEKQLLVKAKLILADLRLAALLTA